MLAALILLSLQAATPQWQSLPLDGGGPLSCVAVSPHEPAVAVAGSPFGGLHRSDDGGRSWRLLNGGLARPAHYAVADVTWHPTVPGRLYAAAGLAGEPDGEGALLVSDDGGGIWRPLSTALRFAARAPHRQRPRLLALDDRYPDLLWAATARDGVWRSDDQGRTWRGLGPANRFLAALARARDGTLYVASEPDGAWPGGLLVLRPRSPGWVTLYRGPVNDVVLNGAPGQLLLATPDKGLLRSADDGESWVNTTPAGCLDRLQPESLAFSPSHPAIGLVTGLVRPRRTRLPNLHLTLDGGQTWQPVVGPEVENVAVGPGWLRPDWFAIAPRAVAFDPANPQRVFLTDANTVWVTHDGAGSWFAGDAGLRLARIDHLALDPADPRACFAAVAGNGVFRCELGPGGVTALGGNGTSLREVDGLASRLVTGGAELLVPVGRHLWRQRERGRWSVAAGEAAAPLGRLAYLPDGRLVAEAQGAPLQLSDDGGQTWHSLDQPRRGGVVLPLRLPAVLDMAGRRWVAGHPHHGLFLSQDAGASWTPLDPPPATAGLDYATLTALPGPRPTLFLAGGDGLWRTRDLGATWARVLVGAPSAVAVDRWRGDVFVAAPAGEAGQVPLLLSRDRGEQWSRLPGDWPVLPAVSALALDERLPRRLWVGTPGNGVVTAELP